MPMKRIPASGVSLQAAMPPIVKWTRSGAEDRNLYSCDGRVEEAGFRFLTSASEATEEAYFYYSFFFSL